MREGWLAFFLVLAGLTGPGLFAASLNSVVVIIHDDSNYQFADQDRNLQSGAELAYQSAKRLGETCDNCEVFIFRHKKIDRNIFGKKKKSGKVSLYRKTWFAGESDYHRVSSDEVLLREESRLYRVNSSTMKKNASEYKRWLVYFGHKIPEVPSGGYSYSFPEQKYSIMDFTRGLQGFKKEGEDRAFHVAVLSTCHGGTPQTAAWLSQQVDYLITSPEKLNLAYLSLEGLPKTLMTADWHEPELLLEILGLSMFDSLKHLKSGVTVALYQLADMREQRDAFMPAYEERLGSYHAQPSPFSYGDCQDSFPEISDLLSGQSVVVFHKPPRFGRGSRQRGHSGWSCPHPVLATGDAL